MAPAHHPATVPPDTEHCRGITISDLHLLAERQPLSVWETPCRIWREQFDLCVLNGDVFDFRWARYAQSSDALASARSWLTALITPHARARFVVLMGNHDATPEYRALLDELAAVHPHFLWREHWFVLGHRVFIHGDMPDESGELHRLQTYRSRHASLRRPRPLEQRVYATATRLGVAGSLPRILPWRRQCGRTDALLRTELGSRYDSITDIYVGHTHVHFRDLIVQGKRFHNGGAPLPRGRFVPLVFEFERHEMETAWQDAGSGDALPG